jgi:hypothetical protein
VCCMAVKLGLLNQGTLAECQQQRWSTSEEQQDTHGQTTKQITNCKGVKTNSNFGQITRIQGKLDTKCKQNGS